MHPYDPRAGYGPPPAAPQAPHAPHGAYPIASPAWQCAFCAYVGPPARGSEVSGAGWVVFILLLLFTCILCPIGLLIREQYVFCPRCLMRGVGS